MLYDIEAVVNGLGERWNNWHLSDWNPELVTRLVGSTELVGTQWYSQATLDEGARGAAPYSDAVLTGLRLTDAGDKMDHSDAVPIQWT